MRCAQRVFSAAWLACLLIAGCAKPREAPTHALVWIRADAELSRTLEQVRVSIYEGDASATAAPALGNEVRFDVTNDEPHLGEQRFPFSFSVVKNTADHFDLSVRGYSSRASDAAVVVEHTVRVLFIAHRGLELSVLLSAADKRCAADGGADACDAPGPDAGAASTAGMSGSAASQARDPVPPVDTEDAGQACAKGAGSEICDPVAQCGSCGPTAHCQVDTDAATCGLRGAGAADQPCSRNRDCGDGLSCFAGACRRTCRTHDDCREHWSLGAASTCLRSTGAHFGFCAQPCGKSSTPKCADSLLCSPLRVGEVADNFCVRLDGPCPWVDNGVCDEAGSGTGLCAAGADSHDCCSQPRPNGSCDIVTQCGCAPNLGCRALSVNVGTLQTGCRAFGPRPLGSVCDTSSQCVRGAGCFASTCKQMCVPAKPCPDGACVPINLSGNKATDGGACSVKCEFATGEPCLEGTVCAQLGAGSVCYVQPAKCPDERYGDHVCDEPSRVCAPNTDSNADCMR